MADELSKAMNEKTLTLGTDRTLKKLEKGEAKKVFISKNCPEDTKNKIMKYKTKAEIVELDITNEELNVRLKKPFNISVLSY
ncbi:ribosomal L7Ae/L30e/S12e/Gadd45 family protein [Candidatus Woesearchaeota archaeon]|nr:ribosomal L7Ae/L30e/S12e/Gadd45 family protein [Candidatus Woesearchaeota archaeon]